jgi:hypothetical protein
MSPCQRRATGDQPKKPSSFADETSSLANERASLANERASLANEKAPLVNEKAPLANEKASLANEKASLANEKASLGNEEASLANEEASLANEEASLANGKASSTGGRGLLGSTGVFLAGRGRLRASSFASAALARTRQRSFGFAQDDKRGGAEDTGPGSGANGRVPGWGLVILSEGRSPESKNLSPEPPASTRRRSFGFAQDDKGGGAEDTGRGSGANGRVPGWGLVILSGGRSPQSKNLSPEALASTRMRSFGFAQDDSRWVPGREFVILSEGRSPESKNLSPEALASTRMRSFGFAQDDKGGGVEDTGRGSGAHGRVPGWGLVILSEGRSP